MKLVVVAEQAIKLRVSSIYHTKWKVDIFILSTFHIHWIIFTVPVLVQTNGITKGALTNLNVKSEEKKNFNRRFFHPTSVSLLTKSKSNAIIQVLNFFLLRKSKNYFRKILFIIITKLSAAHMELNRHWSNIIAKVRLPPHCVVINWRT